MFLLLVALIGVSAAHGWLLPPIRHAPYPLWATRAEDFSGTYPALQAQAFEEALLFLNPEPLASDDVKGSESSLKMMEACFRGLDEEISRDTLSAEQEGT